MLFTVEPGSLHLLERGEQLPATAREASRGGEELEALCEEQLSTQQAEGQEPVLVRDVVLVDRGEQEEEERREHVDERGHVPQRAAVDPPRRRARAQLGECLCA